MSYFDDKIGRSRIDQSKLKKFPVYTPVYRISSLSGSGTCPPTHPWLDAKETEDIERRTHILIRDEESNCWREIAGVNPGEWENIAATLNQIWIRPDESDPAIQAWEREQYRHMFHCYWDDNHEVYHGKYDSGNHDMIIWPVTGFEYISAGASYRYDQRWKDEVQVAYHIASLARAARFKLDCSKVAIPDNHLAVRCIRRYYPDHVARLDWIENPSSQEKENAH